jgi:hypothetical protein
MPERVTRHGTGGAEEPAPSFTDLPPATRRRLVTVSLLRCAVITSVLVTAYFLLPFTLISRMGYLAAFLLGVLVVVAVLVVDVVRILRSPYPRLQAAEALAVTGPLFLVLFASLHWVIGAVGDAAYTQPMTRLDALYFTVSTFATVGFGDIAPVSSTARLVTTIQILCGLVLVGLIARLLIGIAQHSSRRRIRPAPEDPLRRPPPPPSPARQH